MEEKKREQAVKVFQTLCGVLDEKGFPYETDTEELIASFGGRGDDLPMDFRLRVDADRALVVLYSTLPFNIPAEQIVSAALAVTYINDGLLDGCFDLNVTNGRICFRESTTFRESLLGAGALDLMLSASIHVVDKFNDKLLMVGKGAMTVEDLMQEA